MADLESSAMLDVAKGVSQMNDNIKNLNQTIASKNKGNPDGLTLTAEDNTKLEELVEQMKEDVGSAFEMLAPLLDNVNIMADSQSEIQQFQKDSTDILNELLSGQQNEAAEMLASPASKTSKKQTATTKPSGIDVLKDLSSSDGLGFVALWWKLDEIHETMKGGQGSEKKKGSIGDIFKGLLEGASGIALLAVALVVFAGALSLFQFVEWPSALIGMVSFSIFTIGFIQIAKKIGKSVDDFIAMTIGAGFMSVAIGVFAGALILMKFIEWGPALAGLGLFGLFTLGMLGVALLVNENTKNFLQFAVGSTVMAGALLAFSVSIMFSSWLMKAVDVGGAFEAIGFFTLFTLGNLAVATLVSENTGNFVQFALGSIVMAGALAVFSLSLAISSMIFSGKPGDITIGGENHKILGVDISGAIGALIFFGVFIAGMVVVSNTLGSQVGSMAKFAVASTVMSAALLAFSFSLFIAGEIFTRGIHIGEWQMEPVSPGALIGTLAIFAAFMAGMVVLGTFAGSAAAPVAIFAGVSMLMSAAFMVFGFALVTASVAAFGGEADLGVLGHFSAPEGSGLKAIGAVGVMTAFMAAFAGLGALFLVPFAGAAMAAGIAMASGILLAIGNTTIIMAKAIALASLITTGGSIEWEGKTFTVAKAASSEEMQQAFDPFIALMNSVVGIGKRLDASGPFWAREPGVSTSAIYKVGSVAEVVIKIAEATEKTFDTYSRMKNAETAVGGFAKAFDPFVKIMESLVGIASQMTNRTMKALKVITDAMVPVSETLGNLVKMVNDYAAFAGPEGEKKMNQAVLGMRYIMLGSKEAIDVSNANSGFVGMMNDIGNSVSWGAKRVSKIADSVVPITTALGKLIEIIAGDKMTTLVEDDKNRDKREKAVKNASDLLEDYIIPMMNRIGKKSENINAAIEVFGKDESSGLLKVFSSLATISTKSKEIDVVFDGVKAAIEVIDDFDDIDKSDISMINSLSSSLPDFTKALANFNVKQQAADLSASLILIKNSISGFDKKSNPFTQLADSIEASTKSLGRLNEKLDDTIDKMKKLGKETTNAFAKVIDRIQASITTATAAAEQAEAAATGNAVGSVVETILTDWNNNGVPVRGTGDKTTSPVKTIFAI